MFIHAIITFNSFGSLCGIIDYSYPMLNVLQILWCGKSYLIISKCDKCKGSERFGDEDISDFTILHEVLPQVISRHVLCAAADKDFTASHGLIRTNLRGQRS